VGIELAGDNMKPVSIFAITLLSASLIQPGVAQTPVGALVNADSSSQTKQDKKDRKTKSKSTKPPIKAETGTKTTSSQDAAYALAARKGSQKSPKPTPPK
jgi:hypothetical protein